MSERCTHVIEAGAVGATAEDETPSKVCLRPASWRVARPGVRPRYRCDEHVASYRELDFPDLVIDPVGGQDG